MSEPTLTNPEVLADHTDVIRSTSIERIVTGRNTALAQIEALPHQISDISTQTLSIGGGTTPDWVMKQDFRCGYWFMEKLGTAMEAVTRSLNRSKWRDLMKHSGILSIMDVQACNRWYNSLGEDDIPVVSKANILSIFRQLHLSKGEIFQRGATSVFKELSWDLKANSFCGFGTKIIVMGLVESDQ